MKRTSSETAGWRAAGASVIAHHSPVPAARPLDVHERGRPTRSLPTAKPIASVTPPTRCTSSSAAASLWKIRCCDSGNRQIP